MATPANDDHAPRMESILPAVDVRSVYKSYNKKVPVLESADLMVKVGHIYGLLGPSGCGKTTLLRLVVGRLKPNRGRIRVLGYQPGTVESHVPGSTVGYMPQELALYQEFTIEETLFFFGRVHKMTTSDIKNRMEFLLSFLDMPPSSRRIDQLSGGQQRRVSLAVALLHSPPILILDEPTVGVDPLLRQRIWDHLVGISKSANTTIIITTHYIEEARAANTVGLMRSGRILAEGPPDDLLEQFNQPSLENVFLELCLQDEQNDTNEGDKKSRKTDEKTVLVANEQNGDVVGATENGHVTQATNDVGRSDSVVSYDEEKETCAYKLMSCCSGFPKARNIWALFIKNLHVMRKRVPFLLFQFILPAIQITLFSLCIGGVPKDLPVTLVNMDQPVTVPIYDINLSFSEAFISVMDTDVMNRQYAQTLDEAKASVENGSAWAVIYFGPNFSNCTLKKMTMLPVQVDNKTSEGSTILLWMDMTNQQISVTIQEKIIAAFQNISRGIKQQVVKYNKTLPFINEVESFPLKYGDPIYGTNDATFLDFMAPGIICSIIYFMATGLTTLAFVTERKEGLFERSLVSGVTIGEIMLGHIMTQFLVMAVQVAVLLTFTLAIFQVYNVGSIVLIVIFTLMMGLCGMALGFLLSTVATNEQSATQMALASVYPSLLISGILWPIQAMPTWLRYISVVTPITLSAEGLRTVLGRGWDFTYYEVWRGFLVMTAWVIGFLLLSILMAKVKKLN